MSWSELFNMQAKLDQYIMDNHDLTNTESLFKQRYLALLVELGELANETRCFKFWSHKEPSSSDIVIEEYVDGVHFILSLGLEKGYQFQSPKVVVSENTLTEQFIQVYFACTNFYETQDKSHYDTLFIKFLELGYLLGFSENDIFSAYMKKNEVNFKRQNEGY